jgi:hypothetical protein
MTLTLQSASRRAKYSDTFVVRHAAQLHVVDSRLEKRAGKLKCYEEQIATAEGAFVKVWPFFQHQLPKECHCAIITGNITARSMSINLIYYLPYIINLR